jgi:hypothetical protein
MEQNHRTIGLIAAIAVTVAVIDVFIIDVLAPGASAAQRAILDLIIMFVTGYLGYKFSRKSGLPLWWGRGEKGGTKRAYTIMVVVGLIVIILNSVININMLITHREQFLTMSPAWVTYIAEGTPFKALLVSVRAALTEEIVFRLFLISIISGIMQWFTTSRANWLIASGILASMAFAFIHQPSLIPLLFGFMLSYIYINHGLIPVFVVHFLADAIPFAVFSIIYRMM